MQREISYRGQRVDTKEWVYGYLFGIWEKRYILWGTTNDIPNMIEVIPKPSDNPQAYTTKTVRNLRG